MMTSGSAHRPPIWRHRQRSRHRRWLQMRRLSCRERQAQDHRQTQATTRTSAFSSWDWTVEEIRKRLPSTGKALCRSPNPNQMHRQATFGNLASRMHQPASRTGSLRCSAKSSAKFQGKKHMTRKMMRTRFFDYLWRKAIALKSLCHLSGAMHRGFSKPGSLLPERRTVLQALQSRRAQMRNIVQQMFRYRAALRLRAQRMAGFRLCGICAHVAWCRRHPTGCVWRLNGDSSK